MHTDDNRSALLRAAAVGYIELGWSLVPLHDVGAGRCSCDNGAECRTPGKHPRTGRGWELAENLVSTRAAAEAWWGSGFVANIGIATGESSGFWGFDVDPLKGGDESLAELVEMFGPLPKTRRHKTGSGGDHYLFTLPDFAIGGSSGELPRGLDVRGKGGQIVAPPSITDRGGYEVVDDVPLLAAPDWLLALIRPTVAATPASAPWGDLGAGWSAPADGVAESTRLRAYAVKAATGELTAIARATEGNRGITCVRAAYRLIELLNAPWSGLDPQNVWEQYVTAARMAMQQGGKFNEAEAVEAWKSAARKVGTRSATAPADPLAVVAIDPPVPSSDSFGAPPSVGAADPVKAALLPETTTPVDPSSDIAVDDLIAEMLTAEQMAGRPKPRPLVVGLLDLDTTAWMIAEPGAFKSFVALDLACRVANGQEWQGRRTERGGVVYIVAEGSGGMSLRTDAWQREHGPIDPGLRFLPRPVQAKDVASWEVLVRACKRLGPSLVVIDTQARVTVGMEENSATDMGLFVEAAEQIRRATGACVLVIHHLGRNGSNARGSSAIDGAQSTELRLVRKGKELAAAIHQDKQKDADDSEVLELTLRKVIMGHDVETGRELSSLVLDQVRSLAVGPTEEEQRAAATMTVAGKLLAVFEEDFAKGTGGTKAEIMAVLLERHPGISKSARNGAWLELEERDAFRSFEKRRSHYRYVPPDQRVAPGKFRELFSETQ